MRYDLEFGGIFNSTLEEKLGSQDPKEWGDYVNGAADRFVDHFKLEGEDRDLVYSEAESKLKDYRTKRNEPRFVPSQEEFQQIAPPLPFEKPGESIEEKANALDLWKEQTKAIFEKERPAQKEDISVYLEGYTNNLIRETAAKTNRTSTFGDLAYRFTEGLIKPVHFLADADGAERFWAERAPEDPTTDENISSMLAGGIGDSIGQVGLVLLASAATSPAGGVAASTMYNTSRYMKQGYEDEFKRSGDEEKAITAAVYQIPAAMLETVGDLVMSGMGKTARGVAREFAEATTEEAKRKILAKAVPSFTRDAANNFITEAIPGGIGAEWASGAGMYLATGNEEYLRSGEDLLKSGLVEGLAGAIVGTPINRLGQGKVNRQIANETGVLATEQKDIRSMQNDIFEALKARDFKRVAEITDKKILTEPDDIKDRMEGYDASRGLYTDARGEATTVPQPIDTSTEDGKRKAYNEFVGAHYRRHTFSEKNPNSEFSILSKKTDRTEQENKRLDYLTKTKAEIDAGTYKPGDLTIAKADIPNSGFFGPANNGFIGGYQVNLDSGEALEQGDSDNVFYLTGKGIGETRKLLTSLQATYGEVSFIPSDRKGVMNVAFRDADGKVKIASQGGKRLEIPATFRPTKGSLPVQFMDMGGSINFSIGNSLVKEATQVPTDFEVVNNNIDKDGSLVVRSKRKSADGTQKEVTLTGDVAKAALRMHGDKAETRQKAKEAIEKRKQDNVAKKEELRRQKEALKEEKKKKPEDKDVDSKIKEVEDQESKVDEDDKSIEEANKIIETEEKEVEPSDSDPSVLEELEKSEAKQKNKAGKVRPSEDTLGGSVNRRAVFEGQQGVVNKTPDGRFEFVSDSGTSYELSGNADSTLKEAGVSANITNKDRKAQQQTPPANTAPKRNPAFEDLSDEQLQERFDTATRLSQEVGRSDAATWASDARLMAKEIEARKQASATPAQQQPTQQQNTSNVNIINIDELITNGGGVVQVQENGRNVNFDKFALMIDGNTAEIAFIELNVSERGKKLGLSAYEALGKALAEKGITLQSSKAQYASGRNVWVSLVNKGLAKRGAQGVYSFVNNQTPATPTQQQQVVNVPVVPETNESAAKVKDQLKSMLPGLENKIDGLSKDALFVLGNAMNRGFSYELVTREEFNRITNSPNSAKGIAASVVDKDTDTIRNIFVKGEIDSDTVSQGAFENILTEETFHGAAHRVKANNPELWNAATNEVVNDEKLNERMREIYSFWDDLTPNLKTFEAIRAINQGRYNGKVSNAFKEILQKFLDYVNDIFGTSKNKNIQVLTINVEKFLGVERKGDRNALAVYNKIVRGYDLTDLEFESKKILDDVADMLGIPKGKKSKLDTLASIQAAQSQMFPSESVEDTSTQEDVKVKSEVQGGELNYQDRTLEGQPIEITEEDNTLVEDPIEENVAPATNANPAIDQDIESSVTDEDKATIVEELGGRSWEDVRQEFKKQFADFVSGVGKFSKRLTDVFNNIIKTLRTIAFTSVLAFTPTNNTYVSSINVNEVSAFNANLNEIQQREFNTLPESLPDSQLNIPSTQNRMNVPESMRPSPVSFQPTGMSEMQGRDFNLENIPQETLPTRTNNVVTVPESNAPISLEINMFGAKASRQVTDTANWILKSGNNKGEPFIVADKRGGMLYVFEANGELNKKTPALFGRDIGDKADLDSVLDDESASKITPAGRFLGQVASDAEYGNTIDFLQSNADWNLAIHKTYLGTPSEQRPRRLETPDPKDNRISYGCINCSESVMNQNIIPLFKKNGGFVYVLPETRKGANEFIKQTGIPNETPFAEIIPSDKVTEASLKGNYGAWINKDGDIIKVKDYFNHEGVASEIEAGNILNGQRSGKTIYDVMGDLGYLRVNNQTDKIITNGRVALTAKQKRSLEFLGMNDEKNVVQYLPNGSDKIIYNHDAVKDIPFAESGDRFTFRLAPEFKNTDTVLGLKIANDGTLPIENLNAKIRKSGVNEFEIEKLTELVNEISEDGRVNIKDLSDVVDVEPTLVINTLDASDNLDVADGALHILESRGFSNIEKTEDGGYSVFAGGSTLYSKDGDFDIIDEEAIKLIKIVGDANSKDRSVGVAATGRFGVDPYSQEELDGSKEISQGHRLIWSGDLSLNIPGDKKFESGHYLKDSDLAKNQLAFVRGGLHEYQVGTTLPDGTTAKETTRIMEIWEVQSDWDGRVAKVGGTTQEEINRLEKVKNDADVKYKKLADGYKEALERKKEDREGLPTLKDVNDAYYNWSNANNAFNEAQRKQQTSPLLKYWESLALKAAVNYAQKQGASNIIVSDAQTAMMTEGHDNTSIIENVEEKVFVKKIEFPSDVRTTGERIQIALGTKNYSREIDSRGSDVLVNNDTGKKFMLDGDYNLYEIKKTIPKISQEKGMRAAYDQRVPNGLKKILGSKPKMVTVGEHGKGQSKVFKNPDGTPKTKNTGRMFAVPVNKNVSTEIPFAESPNTIRHSELEAKFNAGTITAEETAEAERLVNNAAKKSNPKYDINVFRGDPVKEAIRVFDINKAIEAKGTNILGPGFYFTDKEVEAKIYGNVNRFFISNPNPLVIRYPLTMKDFLGINLNKKLEEQSIGTREEAIADTLEGSFIEPWSDRFLLKNKNRMDIMFLDKEVFLSEGFPLNERLNFDDLKKIAKLGYDRKEGVSIENDVFWYQEDGEVIYRKYLKNLRNYLLDKGYTGVMSTGVKRGNAATNLLMPEGSTHHVVFNPNQIKSAEPFTGVPLNKRFDSTSNDVAFAESPENFIPDQDQQPQYEDAEIPGLFGIPGQITEERKAKIKQLQKIKATRIEAKLSPEDKEAFNALRNLKNGSMLSEESFNKYVSLVSEFVETRSKTITDKVTRTPSGEVLRAAAEFKIEADQNMFDQLQDEFFDIPAGENQTLGDRTFESFNRDLDQVRILIQEAARLDDFAGIGRVNELRESFLERIDSLREMNSEDLDSFKKQALTRIDEVEFVENPGMFGWKHIAKGVGLMKDTMSDMRKFYDAYVDYLMTADVDSLNDRQVRDLYYSLMGVTYDSYMLSADNFISGDTMEILRNNSGSFTSAFRSNRDWRKAERLVSGTGTEMRRLSANREALLALQRLTARFDESIKKARMFHQEVMVQYQKDVEKRTEGMIGRKMTDEDRWKLGIVARALEVRDDQTPQEAAENAKERLLHSFSQYELSSDSSLRSSSFAHRTFTERIFNGATGDNANEIIRQNAIRELGAYGKDLYSYYESLKEFFDVFEPMAKFTTEFVYGRQYHRFSNYMPSMVINLNKGVENTREDGEIAFNMSHSDLGEVNINKSGMASTHDRVKRLDQGQALILNINHLFSNRGKLNFLDYFSAVPRREMSEMISKKGSESHKALAKFLGDPRGQNGRLETFAAAQMMKWNNIITATQYIHPVMGLINNFAGRWAGSVLSSAYQLVAQTFSNVIPYFQVNIMNPSKIGNFFEALTLLTKYKSGMLSPEKTELISKLLFDIKNRKQDVVMDTSVSLSPNKIKDWFKTIPGFEALEKIDYAREKVQFFQFEWSDMVGGMPILLTEYLNNVRKATGNNTITFETLDHYDPASYFAALDETERFIAIGDVSRRGEFMNSRNGYMTVLRHVLTGFAGHRINNATNFGVELKKVMSDDVSKSDKLKSLNYMAAIGTQSAVFTVLKATVLMQMMTLIKYVTETEEEDDELEKLYAKKSNAMTQEQKKMIDIEIAKRREIRKIWNKVEQKQDSEYFAKVSLGKDIFANISIIGNVLEFVPNIVLWQTTDIQEAEQFREIKKLKLAELKKKEKNAKSLGEYALANKFKAEASDLSSLEAVQVTSPNFSQIPFQGMYGGVAKNAFDFTRAVIDDNFLGVEEMNMKDWGMFMGALGYSVADMNKYLNILEDIEKAQSEAVKKEMDFAGERN